MSFPSFLRNIFSREKPITQVAEIEFTTPDEFITGLDARVYEALIAYKEMNKESKLKPLSSLLGYDICKLPQINFQKFAGRKKIIDAIPKIDWVYNHMHNATFRFNEPFNRLYYKDEPYIYELFFDQKYIVRIHNCRESIFTFDEYTLFEGFQVSEGPICENTTIRIERLIAGLSPIEKIIEIEDALIDKLPAFPIRLIEDYLCAHHKVENKPDVIVIDEGLRYIPCA